MIPQYLQIVKGASPTKSGLEMLPLMVGMIIASVVSGQITAKTGRYKIFPTIGTVLMVAALLLFHFKVQWDTPLWESMIYMLVFGLGLGGCMQTLVLAVQNAVPPQDMGVATASSTFFRQMGATAGTAIFLSVLFSNVGDKISSAFKSAAGTPQFQAALHDPAVLSDPANKPVLDMLQHPGAGGGGSDVLSDSSFIQHLDPRLSEPFKQGFADSMHVVFLIAAGVIAVAFLMVLWTKEVPLRKMSGLEARAAEENGTASDDAAETPVTALADTAEAVEAAPVASLATALADEPASGVRGHIRDSVGSPVAGAVVTLIDLRGSQLGRTTTQADGRYAVAAPAEGTYVLIASGGARQPQATTITVADGLVDFDLVLSGAAGLTGTVLATPATGRCPVPWSSRPTCAARSSPPQRPTTPASSASPTWSPAATPSWSAPPDTARRPYRPRWRAAPPTATRSASTRAPMSTAPSATARATRSTTPKSRFSTRRATRSPRPSPTRTAPTRSTTWTPATTP